MITPYDATEFFEFCKVVNDDTIRYHWVTCSVDTVLGWGLRQESISARVLTVVPKIHLVVLCKILQISYKIVF